VFVEGAKLSMGDMHFSQGDGEVSGAAIATFAALLSSQKSAATHVLMYCVLQRSQRVPSGPLAWLIS
jgi:hypothetical protein